MNREDFDAFHDAALKLLRGLDTSMRLRAAGVNGSPMQRDEWRALAQAGWFRALLSEARGGMGLDVAALGAIFFAVGEEPVRGPLLEHAVVLPLLHEHVSAEWATRLDAALDGERCICFAQPLAPPYGPGAQGLRLRGNALHGVAEMVAFGSWADDIVAVADEDGEPVLVMVDGSSAHCTAIESVDPCVDYARIAFGEAAHPHPNPLPQAGEGAIHSLSRLRERAGVRADDAVVLLRGENAARLLDHIADIQRLMIAAEIAGGVQQLLRHSIEYAKTRRQFGRPIGSFQALQHILAEMAARSASLTNLVHATLADAGTQPQRLHALGMIAKAHACSVGRALSQDALQVHGGIGFTAELPLHLHMRRVLTHEGMLGETDALLEALGGDLLEGAAWA